MAGTHLSLRSVREMTDPEWSRSGRGFQDREEAPKSRLDPGRWTSLSSWLAWSRLLRMRFRWWSTSRLLAAVIVSLVFAGSLWVIARELRGFEYAEVWVYLQDLPFSYVLVAVGLTFLTFVVLAGYDALALRYIDVQLSTRRIAFSAFIGYAVSQAIGNPILTGGSVRYRLYSLWGLTPPQVGKAILFAGISFWLGFCSLGAIVFLLQPIGLARIFDMPVSPSVLGLGCLALVVGYAGFTVVRDAPVTLWHWTLKVPPTWMFPVQVCLAAADLTLAASVVYVLLPPEIGIWLPHLIAVYLTALLAGLVSHVPGGLGVFESIMLVVLTPEIPAPTLLGALLAYRGIFHLFPLTVAMIAFGAFELRRSMNRMPGDVGWSE